MQRFVDHDCVLNVATNGIDCDVGGCWERWVGSAVSYDNVFNYRITSRNGVASIAAARARFVTLGSSISRQNRNRIPAAVTYGGSFRQCYILGIIFPESILEVQTACAVGGGAQKAKLLVVIAVVRGVQRRVQQRHVSVTWQFRSSVIESAVEIFAEGVFSRIRAMWISER